MSPLAMETQVQSLGLEDPVEKENGNPLQYSCMENPMDRGVWWETVHGVTKELDMCKFHLYIRQTNTDKMQMSHEYLRYPSE